MRIKKKEALILEKALKEWEEEGLLHDEQAQKLKNSYEIIEVDWQEIAFYSFIFAITSFIIAIIVLLTDNWLLTFINKIADAKDIVKFIFFGTLSVIFFYVGYRRRSKNPDKIYSNEMFFLLGILASATAFVYLSLTFNYSFGHYSYLIFGAALLYGFLGYWFPSNITWLFSLFSLGVWFGFQTALLSDWQPYFLGMSYPTRFTIFGFILTIASFGLQKVSSLQNFFKLSYSTGLLYFFTALWLLSIFGNFGDIEAWMETRQVELFYWSVVSTGLSAIAVYIGFKYNNLILRDFGSLFLVINLYTRYFEYGWGNMHKAIFFAVLAASFWIIGRKAEKFMTRN